MTKVAIFGAGQIGRAAHRIILAVGGDTRPHGGIKAFVIDSDVRNLKKVGNDKSVFELDIGAMHEADIAKFLIKEEATHVINAMPFFLNEKIAKAAVEASCDYIDFTEDDVMADKVQAIYTNTGLTCAVKCGLAPGFINYIGYDLVSKIAIPDTLMISVGALPRTVSYDEAHPELSYNLSWSVDGLVNEYIRPCRVRQDGVEKEIPALTGMTKVIIDGTEYEAAYTSGGIGSLVRDLTYVPNVSYKTLRYPGHYRFVRDVVQANNGNFDKIKNVFLNKFPFTNDDVIVVYANAIGKDVNGNLVRENYSNKIYGKYDLSGIQVTTAGAGVAMLELMLNKYVSGIVDHTDVPFEEFQETEAYRRFYEK